MKMLYLFNLAPIACAQVVLSAAIDVNSAAVTKFATVYGVLPLPLTSINVTGFANGAYFSLLGQPDRVAYLLAAKYGNTHSAAAPAFSDVIGTNSALQKRNSHWPPLCTPWLPGWDWKGVITWQLTNLENNLINRYYFVSHVGVAKGCARIGCHSNAAVHMCNDNPWTISYDKWEIIYRIWLIHNFCRSPTSEGGGPDLR